MSEEDPFSGTTSAIDKFVNIVGGNLEALLTEKDTEIERLQARVAFMASNDYVYSLTSEIERLKSLLARAADALEQLKAYVQKNGFGHNQCEMIELADAMIDELRKAAR